MLNDDNLSKVFNQAYKSMDKKTSKQTAKKVDEKIDTLSKNLPSIFEAIWNDIKLISSLLQDYWNNKYIDIYWTTIAIISVALAYLIMPLDIVPDVIPIMGYIDDALIIRIALQLISIELDRYRLYLLLQADKKSMKTTTL